jgi:hypothetical protein
LWHARGRRETFTGFRHVALKERDHVKDTGVDARIILKWILKAYDGRGWSGLIWLMIGIIGRVFRTQ